MDTSVAGRKGKKKIAAHLCFLHSPSCAASHQFQKDLDQLCLSFSYYRFTTTPEQSQVPAPRDIRPRPVSMAPFSPGGTFFSPFLEILHFMYSGT
jgi:hypothetical protein